MSDYQILTVEQTAGGGLALRRKDADEVVSPGASPVMASASGFPLTIPDAAAGRAFLSVRTSFGPVRAGYGTVSPSNIRRLSPRSPTIWRCGPNLYTGEGDTPNSGYNGEGVIGDSTIARITDHIPVSGENSIVVLVWGNPGSGSANTVRVGMYDADGNLLNGGSGFYSATIRTGFHTARIPLASGTATVRVSCYKTYDLGVYGGSAAESLTLTAPEEAGTVYGGIWDPASGTLTVDRAYISLTGAASEEWSQAGVGRDTGYFRLQLGDLGTVVDDSGISSHFVPTMISGSTTDVGQRVVNSTASGISILCIRPENVSEATVTSFRAWLAAQASAGTPVQVTYKLADPVVYAVDAETISALDGVNTLFSDAWEYGAGYDVAAEYVQDTGAAIEAANADTRAMIGEASGKTASRSLAVGEYVTVGAALYRVTAAIAEGETLVPGTNVAETTVGAELVRLAGMINQ